MLSFSFVCDLASGGPASSSRPSFLAGKAPSLPGASKSAAHTLPPRVSSSAEESSPDETKTNPKGPKKDAKKEKKPKKDTKKKSKKLKKDDQDVEPLPGDRDDDDEDEEQNPSDLDGIDDLLTLKDGKKDSSFKGQKRPAANGPMKKPAKKRSEGDGEAKVGSTYSVLTFFNQD